MSEWIYVWKIPSLPIFACEQYCSHKTDLSTFLPLLMSTQSRYQTGNRYLSVFFPLILLENINKLPHTFHEPFQLNLLLRGMLDCEIWNNFKNINKLVYVFTLCMVLISKQIQPLCTNFICGRKVNSSERWIFRLAQTLWGILSFQDRRISTIKHC